MDKKILVSCNWCGVLRLMLPDEAVTLPHQKNRQIAPCPACKREGAFTVLHEEKP